MRENVRNLKVLAYIYIINNEQILNNLKITIMTTTTNQFKKETTYDKGYGYLTAYYYTGKENFVISKDTSTSWGVACDGCYCLEFKRLRDAKHFILSCIKANYNPVSDYAR